MSAPLLAQAADSDTSWPWLALAARMAADTCRALPPPGPRGPSGQPRFPRLATRTPGSNPTSVGAARDFALSTLWRWGIAGRCDDITLVISELLTNALCHALPRPGGWPIRVGLLQSRPCSAVLCAVADPSQALPVPRQPGHFAESGRGLHVVAQLSDRWGYTTPGQLGKVVWATFGAAGDIAGASADPADRGSVA